MEFLDEKETTEESFIFSLNSCGRSSTPMKFEIKDTEEGYCLYNDSSDHLIDLASGQLILYKERSKQKCMYYQDDDSFDYHNTENIKRRKKNGNITKNSACLNNYRST